MHTPSNPAVIDTDPPIPFTDEEIGSAAHEKHMPSVRGVAVDPDRGLVLLNLVGADASVSAVMMELLRSKSNGVGFMPTLFAGQSTSIPTQLTIQPGIRYSTFRSALSTPGGSLRAKNWCLLVSTVFEPWMEAALKAVDEAQFNRADVIADRWADQHQRCHARRVAASPSRTRHARLWHLAGHTRGDVRACVDRRCRADHRQSPG